MEKLIKEIGAQVRVVALKVLGGKTEKKPGVLILKVESEEDKRELIDRKKAPRERNEGIEESLRWSYDLWVNGVK